MHKRLVARDVMNPEVITVAEDLTVKELATVLTDQEISGAPVEDSTGRLVGVVSLTDIVRAASLGGDRVIDARAHAFFARGWEESVDAEELEELHFDNGDEQLLVRDIMTPSVFVVDEEVEVPHVARTMLDSHLHRLLVVRDQRPVGIISTSDLLQLLADQPDEEDGP